MRISCPWIWLTCIIKLIQTLISECAQISNYSTPPPERYTIATTRSYPSTTCQKVGSWGLRTYHQLYILIQVLVRFIGSLQTQIQTFTEPPILKLRTPILTTPPSIPPTSLRPLTETPHPPANHYGPVNRLYGPLQDLFHPLGTTLHSMTDTSKQINEG